MASASVVIGSLFIVGLFILGVVQSLSDTSSLPKSTLAGAASVDPVPKTQEEINACMKGCMRACVTVEGTERSCLTECNAKCGAP